MLAFPVLVLVQIVIMLSITPWAAWDPALVLLILGVNVLVGVGEELYFRGILRASIRSHHGETLTLVATSLLFGAGHALGSLMAGLPVAFIAIQIGGTALMGAVLYGAFRATGRLWVAIALHALSDFALRISSGDLASASAHDLEPPAATGFIEFALWVLALVLLISCIRQDLRARRESRSRAPTPSTAV
ncbi:CPBP family intramembrane glutamic endopeptidase [Herbiconiux sp. VKM Ac-2851]|uniref:CPBP family intramembrane glutamic endopeptidase n=1 Tax=Herbiconiux sp. VKM Ac-2851 TaxID=2739025 RepID=UPI001566C3BC|nr:CPBP family intramembrane glutamic endopeptidase [Herbiconiux sp. VKM Ac-2851]NQX35056.1 CPBP family intramembrane metalloprotease [Herbiconiux sp. VKM Ac-2851]